MDQITKKIRQAFENIKSPTPDQDRKLNNLRRASEEFRRFRKDEKNRQGFSLHSRLTVKLIRLFKGIGGINMQTTGKLIGGFAVAMLTVVIGISLNQGNQTLQMKIVTPEEKPVTQPATAPQDKRVKQPSVHAPQEKPVTESAKALQNKRVTRPAPLSFDKDAVSGSMVANEMREEKAPPASPSSGPLAKVEVEEDSFEMAETGAVEEFAAESLALEATVGRAARKAERGGSVAYEMAAGSMRAKPMYFMPEEKASAAYREEGRDRFEKFATATVHQVATEPVSTFSSDVDTASYAFVRRQLNQGLLPQKNAVRVEEMINYFPYDYPAPSSASEPFEPTVAVYPTPWNSKTRLLHIGVQGYALNQKEKPASNLVFLIDVSGSMNSPDKLPLAKNALRMLVDSLNDNDTVGLVVYAGAAGVVLEPTKVKEKGKIIAALDNLSAGGSTAGGAGIRLSYSLAERNFLKEGVNRVMLFSDGDFNVGISDRDELKSFIQNKRQSGIFFSAFGFGQGNYNDALMQALAQNGNGTAAYLDNLNEARKVLVDESSSTLFTIATDLKFQVEFNPARIKEYRLIGYETRALNRADFNNDKIDAGDIGSGHRVTAIYEITPADSKEGLIDDLRYGDQKKNSAGAVSDEYGFLKIRYKLPGEDKSRLITKPVDKGNEYEKLSAVPADLRFGAAVAAFGQVLRGGEYTGKYGYKEIVELANSAKGSDPFGYRAEFIKLVRLAMTARGM